MLGESFVEVRGAKIWMRRGGKGEPVLFLHGAQGFAGSGPALELLAARFDVLAPDLPGFGHSDAPDWIDDVPDLAFFLLDALAALDLRAVNLVGQSIGGWAAMEMAIRSTARMKSLTLVGAAGIRVEGAPRTDMFMVTQDELAALLFAGDGGTKWNAELQSTPELHDIFDRNRFAAAKLSWQPRLFNPKLAKWLHRIDRPTHIIWGEQDKIIPPPYAAALKGLIPGASLRMVPNAGHLLHVERPDIFADETARFIARAGS
jgi:pimeloyl-ACP methyl ester carboxylesterase